MTDSQTPLKGIGRTMLTVGWVLALIILTSVFAFKEEHDFNPNSNIEDQGTNQVIEIQLQRNKYNHYVASGKINHKPVVFMLDTGATHVAIPAELSAQLGLKKGAEGLAQTANGITKIWKTQVERLELGPIVLNNVRASINPGLKGKEILLGMSALKDLEFTQKGKVLTIKQFNH